MSNQMRADINRLIATLQKVSLVPGPQKKRRRNRRRGGNQAAVVAPAVQNPVMNGNGSGRRRKGRRGGAVTSDGSMAIQREELVAEIKVSKLTGSLDLNPYNFTWLKTVAKAYDRCTWVSAQVFYKPAVGTSTNGLVVYGVDWNSAPPTNFDRAKIQAYTPVSDHPVWQETRTRPLVLPSAKLMSRKEYLLTSGEKVDQQPGTLCWAHSATSPTDMVLGELWIRYHIRFFGTTA